MHIRFFFTSLLIAGFTLLVKAQDINVGTGSHDQVGYGPRINFIGNSDNCFITQYNVSGNVTEFRFNIGDDLFDDKFVVGVTNSADGLWYPRLAVQADGKVNIYGNGTFLNDNNQYSGNLIIQGNSGNRSAVSGASLEFVIPADVSGGNPWGQARIITVAGNTNNQDATGKLVLGTRRMFNKGTGSGTTWNYGDDLTIDGSGNIGVNTDDTRGYKFAVKGNLHAQQVNVDMINWADYVFKPTYKLPALSEVKSYIDQNQHLPEMPSEQELTKIGLILVKW